ncbi:hypothetical protein Pan97_37210 [Bremerella volcania]|uniref:Chromosome partition protein Smc n=1 Tax=Bremerella volcania TaxID=2527984 RepID=A0A518CBR1_9BACT|nr:hypothetical protein [Bremerella volcania]QDU76666.1 hypothetical protein Pan97_37210 [Bremerella volcania]
METLQKHIRKAQWRMILQQFVGRLIICLSVSLTLAAIAVILPKLWPLGIDRSVWMWSWIGGGAAVGLLTTIVWTYLSHTSALAAAIELDIRFGLKERVSSSLSMDEQSRQTQWGQALMEDATRQVERIDVNDRFPVRSGWNGLAPVAIIVGALLIALFVPDAVLDPNTVEANPAQLDPEQTKVVKKTADELRKELKERKEKAEEKGLKEAEDLFKKLEEGTKDIAKKDKVDQKETLLELNDLAKELKKRRDELASSEEFKKKLEMLKDMLKGGLAEELAKAMQKGDLQKALDAMKDLQNKLNNGDLSKEEREALAKQLEEMGKKMEDIAKAHEDAKKALQQQIKQAQQAGNQAEAERLQKQLDQMGMQDAQMQRMQQMGNQLSKASEALQNGQQKQAADQLNQMANEMQDLQAQLDELEMLDEAMDQMEMARNQMCKACQGGKNGMMGQMGQMGRMGQQPGNGLGQGQGQGDRPEEENETGAYDSQVRADPKTGRGVIVDYVDGKNRAGQTLIEIKSAMESESSLSSDALTETRLSKDHQENAQEYFDMVREGR